MNWKEFLKPDKRKIMLFLLLYIAIPYPFVFTFIVKGEDILSVFYIPAGAPITLYTEFMAIISGVNESSATILDYILFILYLLIPFISYLLSCLIFWIYNNFMKNSGEIKFESR